MLARRADYMIEEFDLEDLTGPDEIPRHLDVRF